MDFKNLLKKIKLLEKEKKGNNKQIGNVVIVILFGILIILAASLFSGNGNSNFTGDKGNAKQAVSSSNTTNDNSNSNSAASSSSTKGDNDYENAQETKLKNLLQKIQGVGKVQVMIYYDRGEEEVPAYNKTTSSSVINETDTSGGKRETTQNNSGTNVVTSNDGDKSEPFIVEKLKPHITGIWIVAQGAENDDVKFNITNSAAQFFNVPISNVNVYPMEK
ncbi:MAG: stage III sporulation protein AG [Clostridium sp.]|nr:stage III sporulation protein AG [Clostridium sp.]